MDFSLKKLMPRSLFGRSLMILVLPILLIQVVTTWVFFDRHWGRMTDRLAFAVAGEVAIIVREIEQNAEPENLKTVSAYAAQNLELLISYEPEGVIENEDYSGELWHTYMVRVLSKALDTQVRKPHVINVDPEEKWVEITLKLENGLLRVTLPQRRMFSSSSYIFLLWMLGASIILLVIAILFMRNQIRPIRRLAVAAERFGKGMDVPTSFKPEGAREVRQAAQAFLDMQERIRKQVQQRTAMLSGVSHDLRTPLTRMKLQLAMIENSPDTEALKRDVNDMESMLNAYLDFARGEGGEQAVYTDLASVLQRLAGNVKRQGKEVDLVLEGDLSIKVRPVAFERALVNVISNAKKFADHIWITARQEDGKLAIKIEDNGPGVPEDKFEDVFKPFFRVDPSRNQSTGGVGLGLPITQDVILSHGGDIHLEKSEKGGLAVIIGMSV